MPERRARDRLAELVEVLLVALGFGLGLVLDDRADHVRSFFGDAGERIASSRVNSTAFAAAARRSRRVSAGRFRSRSRAGSATGSEASRRSRRLPSSGGVIALAALLVVRRSLGGLGDAVGGPKWQLLGGVMGAFIVLAITVAGPRIGVVATTAFLIAAQFALAAVIDRYGWFGVDQVPFSWPRVLGIGLLVVGAALTLRR